MKKQIDKLYSIKDSSKVLKELNHILEVHGSINKASKELHFSKRQISEITSTHNILYSQKLKRFYLEKETKDDSFQMYVQDSLDLIYTLINQINIRENEKTPLHNEHNVVDQLVEYKQFIEPNSDYYKRSFTILSSSSDRLNEMCKDFKISQREVISMCIEYFYKQYKEEENGK